MSNKIFQIKQIDDDHFGRIITATSTYMSPFEDLQTVESELGDYTGKVVFDMTEINGTNSNQYLEANVISGKIDRQSVTISEAYKESLLNTYYEVRLEDEDKLIMDDGRNIKDEVMSMEGTIENNWGGIFIPECQALDTDNVVIKRLNELNAIQPNSVTKEEAQGLMDFNTALTELKEQDENLSFE